MSSKEEKESEEVVKCTNCRQDIEAKKMFLHEGFCHRNNVFCQHCEKVFLKTDYEKHKKKILKEKKNKKVIIKENKQSSEQVGEKKEKEIAAVIKHAPIEVNPKPPVYAPIPIVEEYKINTPIIISENGQILSNKNKNEYILPYLGFDSIQNNYNNNYNLALNNETLMNIEKQSVEEIQNMLYRNNKFNQTVIINRNVNLSLNENINNINNNNINNNMNFYNINNQINNINDINNINQNIFNNNNNININSNKNHIYSKTENIKDQNNNQYIFNKNIPISSNKKIKINNYKNDIYTPEKESFSLITNDSSYKKSAKAPLDKNGHKNSNKKEPTDSASKSDIKSKESLALSKSKPNNNRKIKNGRKAKLINYLKSSDNKIYNDKNNDKNYFIDDNLMNQNIEEYGIDENQKEILRRDFIPLTHNISFNDNKKIFNKTSMKKQITNESVLQQSQKSSIKKKLFSSKEKNKKNLVLTQDRNNRKQIDLKVNAIPKTVNRYNKEILDEKNRQKREIINFNNKNNIYY
jgi:hypothetical protein